MNQKKICLKGQEEGSFLNFDFQNNFKEIGRDKNKYSCNLEKITEVKLPKWFNVS